MITQEIVDSYKEHLMREEKSRHTVEKYVGDVMAFLFEMNGKEIFRDDVLNYKALLCNKHMPSSVNSVLSSLNSFFAYIEREDLRVKQLRMQRQVFVSEQKELTKEEYERLLEAACKKKKYRLYMIMQTVCSTGIRISELKYITVESVSEGTVRINCKGKLRQVFLSSGLCCLLLRYAKNQGVKNGPVFVTRKGAPIDRSNVWGEMKRLCDIAGVDKEKVFPHNLRHLFARTYYSKQKDIVRLADLLGHSSVNTTRIYTMESGEVHKQQIESLGLVYLPTQVRRN